MSHEIEQGLLNGVMSASFYSHRISAWHTLGTVGLEDLDAEQATEAAGLNWEVTKRPLRATVGKTSIKVPGKFATVRQNPFTGEWDVLGVVGSVYSVVQNIENAKFVQALVDEAGSAIETAGSLLGGKRVFYSIRVPESISVGKGADTVDLYMVATNTHDGSATQEVNVTPIRPVCANTLRAGMERAVSRIKIPHKAGAQGRVQEARETLGLTFKYGDAFDRMANALYEQEMTDREFSRMVEDVLLPITSDVDRERKARDEKIEAMRFLFNDAPTQANIRGTKWAAYNAVGEFVDWAWPVAGGTQQARAERVATSSPTFRIEKMKQTALDYLRA